MKLSMDQVKKVAKLANLPVSDEETDKYSQQLSKILDYVDQLNSVDTAGIEPTYNVTDLDTAMRADEVSPLLSQVDALQNSSNTKNGLPAGRQGYFVTKGVFESE